MTEQDTPEVRFTLKELIRDMDNRHQEALQAINHKLDTIQAALPLKADRALVDLLAEKIESVKTAVPTKLVEEHARLIVGAEVQKEHADWVDDEIHKLEEWREGSLSVRAMIIPSIALLVTSLWTVFSIVDRLTAAHPLG